MNNVYYKIFWSVICMLLIGSHIIELKEIWNDRALVTSHHFWMIIIYSLLICLFSEIRLAWGKNDVSVTYSEKRGITLIWAPAFRFYRLQWASENNGTFHGYLGPFLIVGRI